MEHFLKKRGRSINDKQKISGMLCMRVLALESYRNISFLNAVFAQWLSFGSLTNDTRDQFYLYYG